jgi:hypothetical protein
MSARLSSLSGPLGFALAGLVSGVSLRWWGRRFEFVADRGAVELTNDPGALITALVRIARLNDMPADWSRAQEWMLTHPSVRRRAHALARVGHLSANEADALVDAPPDDPEFWNLPASREPVFGTPAKRARATAISWALMLACVLAPALLFAAMSALGIAGPRLLVFAIAAIASFCAGLGVIDVQAVSGYAAWERAIAERQGRRAGVGCFVGLAPGESGVTFEGFADWDLGYLDIDPIALRFQGERSKFALERERIMSIELVAGLPGWFRAPRVLIRWRGADGSTNAFTLRDGRARRVHHITGLTRRLLALLSEWHAQPGPAGVHALGGSDPPRADDVTGTPHAELAAARSLIPVAAVVAGLALLASIAVELPLVTLRSPGAFDVIGVSLLAVVAMRIPLWRAARVSKHPAKPRSMRAA